MNSSTFHFLKIPAVGTSRFFSVIQKSVASHNNENSSLVYDEFSKYREEVNPKYLGVMLTCPINRLVNAYNQMYQHDENKPSFEKFFTNPSRVNFYSRLFSDIPLDSFGLIAIDTSVFKSLLLAEDWLSIDLGRFHYDAISSVTDAKDISPNDLASINNLYAKDIEFFNAAKKIFEKRWHALVEEKQCKIKPNKNITIHIGPPKTGTSAIQYWFKQHSKSLSKEGIWYPEHQLDGNNISSGNVDSLITNVNSELPSFYDHKKAKDLIKQFNSSDAKLLLLSSEHFFYYMPWLFAFLPGSRFVFYVRHPLSAIESGFHQQVKRHRHTESFTMPNKISFQQLEILKKISLEFLPELVISYFDKHLFKNGSLIEDFVSLLPLNISHTASAERINSQYCHEAIELMRFCNSFASDEVLSALDKFLQQYSQSQPPCSFIKEVDLNVFRDEMKVQAKQLTEQLPQLKLNKMMQLISNYTLEGKSEAKKEALNFNDIIKQLKAKELLLIDRLSTEMNKSELSDEFCLSSLLTLNRRERALIRLKKISQFLKSASNNKS